MFPRFIVSFCLLFAVAPLPAYAHPPVAKEKSAADFMPRETFEAIVTRVLEADLLVVKPLGARAAAGEQEAWLLGSDTPEPGQGSWTDRARAHVKSLVEGKRVRLALDAKPRARCGRLRVYVTLPDGGMLNVALVRDGWAEAISKAPNLAHDAALRKAEAEAKAAGRGIWARKDGLDVMPSAYRHAHGDHEEPAAHVCTPGHKHESGTSGTR